METYAVTVTGTVDADGPDEALDLVQSGEWSPDLDGASVDTEPLTETPTTWTTYRAEIPADSLAARRAHSGDLRLMGAASALGVGYQASVTGTVVLWVPAADASHASATAAQVLAAADAPGNPARILG